MDPGSRTMIPKDIARWAVMDFMQANQWIVQVRPLVKTMVSPALHNQVDGLTLVGRQTQESPYGDFLGSWLGLGPQGPIIYTQENWAKPLWLMFFHTPHWLMNEGPFICQIRMRMGITNDVWQPFVKNPAVYSMIRHHALMLAAAWCWLPVQERRHWTLVIEDQLQVARRLFGSAGDVVAICNRIERTAQMLWASPRGSVSDEESHRVMGDYYLASMVGIAALVRRLIHMDPSNYSTMLSQWAVEHIESDFNVERMHVLWKTISAGGLWTAS